MTKKKALTSKKIVLAICSIFIVGIGFGFIPEILGEDLKIKLKEILGDDFLIVILGFLGFIIIVWLFTFFYDDTEKEDVKTKSKDDLRLEFLKNLKQLYERRLHDKMLGELHFEVKLDLKYTTKGTSSEAIEDFFIIKNESKTGDFDLFFEKYVDQLWRLLILGEPGAGKSILLLRFGIKLIDLAKQDANFPIPILLDLATWKDVNQTFEHWLEMNLPYIGGSFAVSKEYAKTLIESKNMLPLLDGFDEIGFYYRDSCFKQLIPYLQKVKNARKESYPEVIICSRILEYEAAEDAPVFASVKIQPLTKKEINSVLKPLIDDKNFPAAKRLQTALNDTSNLYKAITSAFFMHTLLDISQNVRPNYESDSKELLQHEITESYITSELDKITSLPKGKVKIWLGWLAWKMKYLEGSISFELIDLQPWWAKGKWFYRFMIFLPFFLLFGYGFFYFNGISGFFLGFVIASFITFLLSVSPDIKPGEVKTFDLKTFNWSGFILNTMTPIIALLIIGIIISIYESSETNFWTTMFFFLKLGLLSPFYGIMETISIDASLPTIKNPYKRFFTRFWKDTFLYIFAFTIIMLFNSDFSYSIFIYGIFMGMILSFLFSSIFQHCCIRFILWREKGIPRKLVSFLDCVSETGLLIKDGGKWRFRHQLIHDKLADWFQENHPELLKKNHLEELEKQGKDSTN